LFGGFMISLLAAAAPIIGGLIGQGQAAGARTAAENDAKNALGAIQNVQLPDIDKMRLALEQYQSMGGLTPSMETAQTLGPTALQNIQLDPKYNEYTMAALQKMADVSQQGLPEVDRAQLQNILSAGSLQNTAQQKAILENRAMRGMGGSGDELAAQLSASQAGTNKAANDAMQLAAIAAQRKLDATGKLGDLAQQLQKTQYGMGKDAADASDLISRFNAQQMQGVGARNVDRSNLAAAGNLSSAQGISDRNVDLRNKQQQFNKALNQQEFENEMRKAGSVSSGFQNMSNLNAGTAANTANQWAQIGSGIGQIAGSFKPSATTPSIIGDQTDATGGLRVKSGNMFQE
jgi:hypothetical protein